MLVGRPQRLASGLALSEEGAGVWGQLAMPMLAKTPNNGAKGV